MRTKIGAIFIFLLFFTATAQALTITPQAIFHPENTTWYLSFSQTHEISSVVCNSYNCTFIGLFNNLSVGKGGTFNIISAQRVNLTLHEYSPSRISFTAEAPSGENVTFILCNLTPDQGYVIKKNGTYLTTKMANTTGCIQFSNSEWSEVNFTIEADTTPPTITEFYLSAERLVYGRELTIQCKATDNNRIESISIADNNEIIKTCYADTCSITITPSLGYHEIKCIAADTSRNRASATKHVYVYTTSESEEKQPPRYSYLILKLTPEKQVEINITQKDVPITKLKIKVKRETTNAKIEIIPLQSNPTEKEIKARTYQYVEINHQNLENEIIESLQIEFRVSREWIRLNNIDENRINLYRYAGDEWHRLPTAKINEDENFIYYLAESPGLSYFAIAGEKKICEENARRCSGNKLEQCINNSWQILETCRYGCNATTLTCNPEPTKETTRICEENSKRCSGNELQICRNNEWQILETCRYGCNPTLLTCNPEPEKPWKMFVILLAALVCAAVILLYSKIRNLSNKPRKNK